MGLFERLFARADKLAGDVPFSSATTIQQLIEQFGGIAFEKQLSFGEVIGDNNWNVDVVQGTISFGPRLVFPMQILGTISHSSQTWLWAWANTKSGLTAQIIEQSLQLKKFGERNTIELLQKDTFDFSKDRLHHFGVIASGMFNANGYYIADYGQGAMVVTVKSSIIDQAQRDDHHRMLVVFPQLISQFEVDHKNALMHYLRAKGYNVTTNGDVVRGAKSGNSITGSFDASSRLMELKG